ncbi:MAG: hypothetical protein QXR48_04270 [Candidatus Woesearchaeota archaeon]
MAGEIFSHKHSEDESCPNCGTPIRRGVTTQYLDGLDAEICAVREQPLAYGEHQLTSSHLQK